MKKRARGVVPHYTYLRSAKDEENLPSRRVLMIAVATAVILAVLWFWGTSFINLLGFVAKPEQSDQQQQTLNLPIEKPSINTLPDFTNSEKITVSGSTSPNQEVTLVSPNEVLKSQSSENGDFTFKDVLLKKGVNLIKVFVLDTYGNKLEETTNITYDNTAPSLEITRPQDGQVFSVGTTSIVVAGATEEDTIVFINNLQVIINPNGHFKFNYPVNKNTSKLEIKATDKAGNVKKAVISVVISGSNQDNSPTPP